LVAAFFGIWVLLKRLRKHLNVIRTNYENGCVKLSYSDFHRDIRRMNKKCST
jgi:hypothetical protein